MRISETLQQKHFQLLVIVAVFIVILITLVATSNNQQILSHTTRALSPRSTPTLTRIGSDLEFDYSSCPPSSVMLNSTQLNTAPLHDDCPHVFVIGARGKEGAPQYINTCPVILILVGSRTFSWRNIYFSVHCNKKPWSEYVSEFPTDKMSGDFSVCDLVDCHVPQRIYSNCGRTAQMAVLYTEGPSGEVPVQLQNEIVA